MPILKSFLKDGEAESYRNVQVKFPEGRKAFHLGGKAIMTIYQSDDGEEGGEGWVEKEKIVLSDYETKEEMHALMVEKGFQLKTPEEIEAMQQQMKDEEDHSSSDDESSSSDDSGDEL